jgi:hypothetical protein
MNELGGNETWKQTISHQKNLIKEDFIGHFSFDEPLKNVRRALQKLNSTHFHNITQL